MYISYDIFHLKVFDELSGPSYAVILAAPLSAFIKFVPWGVGSFTFFSCLVACVARASAHAKGGLKSRDRGNGGAGRAQGSIALSSPWSPSRAFPKILCI